MKKRAFCFVLLAVLLWACVMPTAGYAGLMSRYKVREGDEDYIIIGIRERLIELGYMTSKSNMNRFTSQTAEAYKMFERANGFEANGVSSFGEWYHLKGSDAVYAPVKISYSALKKNAANPSAFSLRSYKFTCRFEREEDSTEDDLNALCYMGKGQWLLVRMPNYWNWTFNVKGTDYCAPALCSGDKIDVKIAKIIGSETYWDAQGNDMVIPVVDAVYIGLSKW